MTNRRYRKLVRMAHKWRHTGFDLATFIRAVSHTRTYHNVKNRKCSDPECTGYPDGQNGYGCRGPHRYDEDDDIHRKRWITRQVTFYPQRIVTLLNLYGDVCIMKDVDDYWINHYVCVLQYMIVVMESSKPFQRFPYTLVHAVLLPYLAFGATDFQFHTPLVRSDAY